MSRTPLGRSLFGALLVFFSLACGCAVNRHILTRQELECRRAEYLELTANDRSRAIDKIVQRMLREQEAYREGKVVEPVFDVLIISGGGDKGAFAAGFLAGWSTVDGAMARPKFDVVTGLSSWSDPKQTH